jgi:hypothetical protein
MKKIAMTITILIMTVWSVTAAAYEGSDVDIHGFISQGFIYSNEYNYLATETTGGSFEYNEVGINFSRQLTDGLRIGMQLFSRDVGDAANNKVSLDWAYGDYRHRDWLGLRIGRIKLPMGLYNETRDTDMLRTWIVMPQGIYSDFERDNLIALNGVGLYGNVDARWAGNLDYQFSMGTINSDPDNGFGKLSADDLGGLGSVNGQVKNGNTFNGALRWETPLPGFKLGYTITNEERIEVPVLIEIPGTSVQIDTIVEGSGIIKVYSAEYSWNNLVMTAEYVIKDLEGEMEGVDLSKTTESYYLSAAYRFTDWFALGAYYAEYYPDQDDKDGDDLEIEHRAWEKDLVLTLRFDINEYWIFKIEGHSVDGTARVFLADNADNDFSEDKWYYGAAKMSLSF